MNILFVCTGNTCRSPMAEAILKNKNAGHDVRSAGIFADHGTPVSQGAVQVMEEEGTSIDSVSEPVSQDLLSWADLILTMTEGHKQMIAMQYQGHEDKLFTLKEYVLVPDEKWDRLKSLYSRVEEKRNQFRQEEAGETAEEWQEACRDELEEIEELEDSFPDVNVMDPFGANVEMYRETYRELERYIDLLIEKLGDK